MKKIYLIAAVLLLAGISQAQQLPCSKPVYRQFDFWIGEWDVFAATGAKAGDSKISLTLDSCTILEEWTSNGLQNGLRYAGKSYNMYNAAKERWQQYWVDNTGAITQYFNGHYENDKMIVQTDNERLSDSVSQVQKMTFYKLGPDRVRQHGETSKDNGKTWLTSFDLEYRRKAANPAAIADSILRGMEAAYNTGDFGKIASFYADKGKVIGKGVEVSGREALLTYWKNICALGGTWKLSNDRTEKIGAAIWQKGVSVISAKDGKKHSVSFTLVLIQEDGAWKILQDAYW